MSEQKCPHCGSGQIIKNGKTHNKKQNHICKSCGREFVDEISPNYGGARKGAGRKSYASQGQDRPFDQTKSVTCRVPVDVEARIAQAAQQAGKKSNAYLVDLLEQLLPEAPAESA